MHELPTLGAYRLVAELGHGGMADVYLAASEGPAGTGFTKLAVLKKLRENLAGDPEFVAMLMDEARITARLSHPNVVQLFEIAQDKDTYFLAIEFLEGQPLHRLERRAQKLGIEVPIALSCAIVADVLAGLHHAHELRDYDQTPLAVVHRDVTPHNVFVTYDGGVKVLDFGLAKAMGRRTTETQQGVVKGKLPYMSPEQVSGRPLDRRTDIFAAGVLLWNAATGRKLWAGRNDMEIVRALGSGSYDRSPRSVVATVPLAIDAICRRALAPRREDRYATADEMRADLEAFLGEGSRAARRKLETMMKEIFARERAKLRVVLEQARLSSSASAETLAAMAAKAALEGVPRTSERLIPLGQTPPRSRKRTPAVALAPAPVAILASPAAAFPSLTFPTDRPKGSPRGRALVVALGSAALTAAVGLFAFWCVTTLAGHDGVRATSLLHVSATSDVTPLWPISRSKDRAGDPGVEPEGAHQGMSGGRRAHHASHGGAIASEAPSAEPSADPVPSPPKVPEKAPDGPPPKRLDETLPW